MNSVLYVTLLQKIFFIRNFLATNQHSAIRAVFNRIGKVFIAYSNGLITNAEVFQEPLIENHGSDQLIDL